jgi:ComF family protein
VVVPVPLHWRRRWTRGYDHAWLLALHACAMAKLPPPLPALRRVRAVPPQSTLAAPERRANLQGVFAIVQRHAKRIAGRDVVLVDDVVTTGSTFAAASEVLVAHGARTVTGVALARA